MHPLWGPIRKIYRAQHEIGALEEEINDFIKAGRYGVVVAERNPNTGKYALRAVTTSEAEPPLEWSIAVGEIAHNLRSALDHLACQLALTEHPPSEALFEKTSFPIYLYGPGSSKPAKKRWSETRRALEFISRRHRTILERLQPYSRRDRDRPGPIPSRVPSGGLNPLWLLHEINNADKHRLIQVTARIARGMTLIVRSCPPSFDIRDIQTRLGRRLVNGAYIGALDVVGGFEGVDMYLSLQPQVVFWDGCDAVKGLPVIPTLRSMLHEVFRIGVHLAAQFPPLEPPWGPPE